MENVKGTIFNIQRFSVHDGPGIRTVVFLKGCPLRCKWCANPESQERYHELAWTKSKCIKCYSCEKCELKSNPRLTNDDVFWDRYIEDERDLIERSCPTGALHIIGYEADVSSVLKKVDREDIFYSNLDGGLTISGGEPLMQPQFTYELLKDARKEGIHTAIETTGYADSDVFIKIVDKVDYLLMDIKSYDEDIHKKNTGVSNKIILDNFIKVRNEYPKLPIQIRTPVIPGFNDNEEEISKIHDFLFEYDYVKYELLKYHRLGESKYESLHREYPMGDVDISKEKMKLLKKYEFDKVNNSEITGPYEGI